MTFPYIRNNSVSPDKIESFTFYDFTGGINNRKTPMMISRNEAYNIQNMSFNTEGGMEKRGGTEDYDSLDLDGPIVYMDLYKPINLPEVLIRATETKVYAGETLIKTVAGKIQGVNYIGNYYFVDGEKYYQYDGTNVYEIKKPPEAYVGTEVAIGATSVVLQEWDARITVDRPCVLEGINGVEVRNIATINAGTKTITIDATTYLHPVGTLIRFYEPRGIQYVEGVEGVDETLKVKWYEPCGNELDDMYKGENFIPTQCTCIQYDSERLYIAGDPEHPNEVYLSDINNPFYMPVLLGMQCPPNGDRIIELVSFDDAIVVGRKNDIHVIYGETSDTTMGGYFTMKRFDTHTGMASRNNAREANNFLFYLGSDMELYAMRTPQSSNLSLSTTILSKDKVNLKLEPFNFTKEQIENAPAIFYQGEYYIAVGDTILVYNYVNRGFTKYYGIGATYFLEKDGVLLYGTSDGKTKKPSATYSDSGVAIECFYRTGQDNLYDAVNYKDILEMYAVIHTYDDYASSISLTALVDYQEVNSDHVVSNTLSRFGQSVFGDVLISKNISQSDNIQINLRGRVLTLVFGNDVLDEPMKLYQITGLYKVRGRR